MEPLTAGYHRSKKKSYCTNSSYFLVSLTYGFYAKHVLGEFSTASAVVKCDLSWNLVDWWTAAIAHFFFLGGNNLQRALARLEALAAKESNKN